ncbi:hypothetical protein CEXT_114401 [Caerostris extrusa]|uniref:Uncharacterized protein n=1 Tax=Caerostris extrusa TaxID=172846 RepID=A0AAV4W2T5_CAEEX|nr:hypothetical protein CEXT_114401 [Caerostris extrusa]
MNTRKPNKIQTPISHIDFLLKRRAPLEKGPPSTNKHGTIRNSNSFHHPPPLPLLQNAGKRHSPKFNKTDTNVNQLSFPSFFSKESRKQHQEFLILLFHSGGYTYPNINPDAR